MRRLFPKGFTLHDQRDGEGGGGRAENMMEGKGGGEGGRTEGECVCEREKGEDASDDDRDCPRLRL